MALRLVVCRPPLYARLAIDATAGFLTFLAAQIRRRLELRIPRNLLVQSLKPNGWKKTPRILGRGCFRRKQAGPVPGPIAAIPCIPYT